MAYGIALDIGTTTVSASLVDTAKRKVIKRSSSLNGQLSYGHDIISRVKYVLCKKNGLKRLNSSLISSIDFVFDNLIKNSAADPEDIEDIIVVGNALMYHFLFSFPVDSFVTPPYKPYETEKKEIEAKELGFRRFPKARLKMLPNIAGFVGSDAVAVMFATGLYKSDQTLLAMDIGTNGEIIFGSKERIWVSSTAAGPAFESWHITCGMRPVEGAIERAEELKGEIKLGVIGGGVPKGISGSGLIDLAAILIKRGLIDKTGRLKGEEFIVHKNSKKIIITQNDVREIQLAKAAFSVGIKVLRSKRENKPSRLYITGTFGNYINKQNARTVGLVPDDIEVDRIEFLKDGALTGAEMILANPDLEKDIDDILEKTEHISLAEDKNFQKQFALALHF